MTFTNITINNFPATMQLVVPNNYKYTSEKKYFPLGKINIFICYYQNQYSLVVT